MYWKIKERVFLFNISSSSSSPASVSLWHGHSGVAVFHYPSRGQKDTRLCTYCHGYIIGLSFICHFTIYPRDPTNAPPPPLLLPVTSPGLLLSLFPSSLNTLTIPPPDPVQFFSPFPLPPPPPALQSVPGLPALSAAENLQ